MKILILLIAAIYGIYVPATAQKSKAYPVKVGEIPNQVLPVEAMYVSPLFKSGTVFFRNGTTTTQQLNYNFLLDEMHFIGEKGDTLAVAEPVLLTSVAIDSMVFYFDKFFVRQVYKKGNYKLAIRQQMVQMADKTRGGYDAASGSSSITTYGTITNSSQIYHLQVNKDVMFEEMDSYYLSDGFNHFFKADKKNFLLLFPDVNISKYVKDNKVNFYNLEQLKLMLNYCAP